MKIARDPTTFGTKVVGQTMFVLYDNFCLAKVVIGKTIGMTLGVAFFRKTIRIRLWATFVPKLALLLLLSKSRDQKNKLVTTFLTQNHAEHHESCGRYPTQFIMIARNENCSRSHNFWDKSCGTIEDGEHLLMRAS